jgi:rod shape-determining protein MreD
VALLMSTSRREAEVRSYPLPLIILVPIIAVGLQSFVSLHFAGFAMLDLPLLATIYFALTRRDPIFGTITGALIGILQDALTGQPLGAFGICKAVIGYLAASLGVRIDTENHGARLLLVSGFALLHNGIYWVVVRHLLARPMGWSWLHELARALIDGLVGVVLFALLDRAKPREY